MIKCIGIRERDGELRYGVCPYAVLGSAGGDTRGGWGCRVCSGRRPVPLTLERIRDPRLACLRGHWSAASQLPQIRQAASAGSGMSPALSLPRPVGG
jgi:hypothetical protein